MYTEILAAEPDWPEALHEFFWFLTGQGDLARVRTTTADARRDYEEAHRMAQHLSMADPGNSKWQRDLGTSYDRLGDVAVKQGNLAEAAQAYRDSLAIRKHLAASDPGNTDWQRDLSESYAKLAGLAELRKRTSEARTYWKQAFDVLSRIDQRGLHLSPEDREWLGILRRKAGADAG